MTKRDFQLGDAPIQEEHREKMVAIAKALDDLFNGDERPKKIGFVVMVFPFGSGDNRCNYVSNAEREDVLNLLKEQVARFEGTYNAKG